MNGAPNWFALFVRTRWEGRIESILQGKGFETYLPTYKANVRAKASSRDTASALFPGYLFCRFDVHKRLPILVTPGVISVVGRGKLPSPLEESEMASIQKISSAGLPVQPWPYLEIGEKVRIRSQALAGIEGILINFRGTDRVVVSVPLLRRSVALEIARAEVVAIPSERQMRAGCRPSLLSENAHENPWSVPQSSEFARVM